jgi:hypothetical protein
MKFDGKNLKDGSRTIANVRGDKIYEGIGNSKCLANVRSGKLYEGIGNSRTLTTMKDIDKAIDGTGGTTKAALWIAKVR